MPVSREHTDRPAAATVAASTTEANESWLLEDSEDEDTGQWKPTDAPAYEWKAEDLDNFLVAVHSSVPELVKIVDRQKSPFHAMGNDFYTCVFRDAQWYLSKELRLSSTILLLVPQYEDAIRQAMDAMDVQEWLGERIDDLVRDTYIYEHTYTFL